mgnify:FL=1
MVVVMDVLVQACLELFYTFKTLEVEKLGLQCSEKTLDHRIVQTVPFSRHALLYASILQRTLVSRLLVLGGFNRSSQHWIVVQTLDTHSVLRQVFSSRVFFEV